METVEPIRRRVAVPLNGPTITERKAQLVALGIDPQSPEARLVVALTSTQPDWIVTVTFEVGADGVVPAGVEVLSTRGKRVSRAVWDRVRLAEAIDDAAATARWLRSVADRAGEMPNWNPVKREARAGRPRTYTDQHYRRVASVYNTAQDARVRAVARAFESDFPGLTAPTDRRARAWVRECRRLGLITDNQKGEIEENREGE